MNRAANRRKRFQRKLHQKTSAVGVRKQTFVDDDGKEQTIETPRGPKPNRHSYHKTDTPVHGDRLDAAGKLEQIMREYLPDGYPIDGDLRHEFSRLIKKFGSREKAGEILAGAVETYGGTYTVSAADGGTSNPVDFNAPASDAQTAFEQAAHAPNEEDWEDFVATAKRRKRGIATFMRSKGFTLVDGRDPRKRTDWRKI